MNLIASFLVQFTHSVDRITQYIEQTTPYLVSNGYTNGSPRGNYFHTTPDAIGGIQGNGTYGIFANVLLTFNDQLAAIFFFYFKGVINVGDLTARLFKAHVDHRTDDLYDFAFILSHGFGI